MVDSTLLPAARGAQSWQRRCPEVRHDHAAGGRVGRYLLPGGVRA
ncbi:hypothetical protein ACU4GD_44975 [Cupriavidus basilensis]